MRGITALALAAAAALASATASNAARSNVAAYRAQVNALCRSYTPKLRSLEADMAAAKRVGNSSRYGYDAGYALALALKEGLRIEQTAVPADAQRQMALPLRMLHNADLTLRRTLAAAVAGDGRAFAAGAAQLAKLAAPMNRRFDAVGLRDCGSNQG
jgi:hypothetical protein